MTEGIWIAIVGGAVTLVTALATGIAAGMVRVVNLVLTQSRDTIANVQAERDYWRELAEDCREPDRPPDREVRG